MNQSPVNYWQNNITLLENDKAIYDTINCLKASSSNGIRKCVDEQMIPVQEKAIFGGISKSLEDGQESIKQIGKQKNKSKFQAKVMFMTYLLNNQNKKESLYLKWENKVEELI